MNNTTIFSTIVLTIILLLSAEKIQARYLNVDAGRFQTMDTYEGNNEEPLSLHKYLYAQDNPVDHVDPSGHDIGDLLTVMDIGSGFLATIMPVTSSAFSTIALPSTKYVYYSVDPTGMPSSFGASSVQTLMQSQLSANVFDALPAGQSMHVSVHVEAGGPGTLGWTGSPKHTYINRVRWDVHGIVSIRDKHGLIQIDPMTVDSWCSAKGGSPTAQTWVNIFAHEGVYGNAAGLSDHFGNEGEIGDNTGNALLPYWVLPRSRTDIRHSFGF